MKEFAVRYCFTHMTSSSHYPQSNGLAERTVKTVKKLISNTDDPYLALLSYRATPLPWCGLSPAATQGNQSPGTVSQQLETPRSYTVDTPTGQVRRNRRHLRCRSENTTSERPETVHNQSNRDSTESGDTRVIQTRSRTGTVVHPPDRFSN